LRGNCAARGFPDVETAVMDGMDLELPDDTFDVAASLFGLMFFPDHMRGLAELFRVTKPGGQAVVTTWALPARVELMRLIGETAMQAGIEVLSETTPTWLELASERELTKRMLAQGFSKAHVVTVTHVWVLESAELFADILPLMTPSSVDLFRHMSDAEKQRFREVLVDGFHERQGAGPYAVTSQGLIAVGTKPRV
jgi:SAM-dependent methyltransferase